MDEYNQYELHHKSRLAAKPGLTGMWQVSGRSDFTDFEEIVKMDSDYIKNWNIGLDIKIILKTVLVVLGQKGSVYIWQHMQGDKKCIRRIKIN